MTDREKILEEAKALICGDRQVAYGPPEVNFLRIAKGWSIILKTGVTPQDVALCMAWLKIARLAHGAHHDSFVGGAAYMALAGELAKKT